jgi:hypothetical protein
VGLPQLRDVPLSNSAAGNPVQTVRSAGGSLDV